MHPRRPGRPTGLTLHRCLLYWLDVGSLAPGYDRMLRPADLLRRDRLARPEDRHRLTAGRVLTYAVLEMLLGLPAGAIDLEATCPGCGRPHVKPRLSASLGRPDVDFSISHGGDLAVLAVATRAMVGADVERLRDRALDAGLARHFLHPEELTGAGRPWSLLPTEQVLTYWVRKESLVKATGEGMRVRFDQIVVTAPDQCPRLVRWAEHDHLVTGARMWQARLPGGHLAVATLLPLDPWTDPHRFDRHFEVVDGAPVVDAALRRYATRADRVPVGADAPAGREVFPTARI